MSTSLYQSDVSVQSTAIFQREGQNDVLTGLELGLVPFLQWRLDWMIFRWLFQINIRILLCYTMLTGYMVS